MSGKIHWGEILYIDCLDEKKGLPSLPDNSIDLAIADFPFNIGFKGTQQKSGIEEFYDDNMSQKEYIEFCKKVFFHLKRITKGQVIFCGERNQKIWYKYISDDVREEGFVLREKGYSLFSDDLIEKFEEKIHLLDIYDFEKESLLHDFREVIKSLTRPEPEMIPHYAPNRQGRSSVAYLGKYDPILFYGKFNGRLPSNVIIENVKIGKNRELRGGKHPCPGCSNVYRYILYHLKPKSIIDPFMGSGTSMQVAMELGIKWTGYEINGDKFHEDIERRKKMCRIMNLTKKQKNKSILDFV